MCGWLKWTGLVCVRLPVYRMGRPAWDYQAGIFSTGLLSFHATKPLLAEFLTSLKKIKIVVNLKVIT